MFTTFCIGCMFSFAGGFLYTAIKGDESKNPKSKRSERDFYLWLADEFDRRNGNDTHSNRQGVEENMKD